MNIKYYTRMSAPLTNTHTVVQVLQNNEGIHVHIHLHYTMLSEVTIHTLTCSCQIVLKSHPLTLCLREII